MELLKSDFIKFWQWGVADSDLMYLSAQKSEWYDSPGIFGAARDRNFVILTYYCIENYLKK